VTAGGGMGRSHGNQATFPRNGGRHRICDSGEAGGIGQRVVTIHRDFGDRTDRKHARLKYVIEDRGVDWFRGELERRVGFRLEPARPFGFERQRDWLGWHRQHDGRWFLGLFVFSGRIKDVDGHRLKTALRRVVEQFDLKSG